MKKFEKKFNGEYLEYFEIGNIKEENFYKDGKLVENYENGSIVEKKIYKNGVIKKNL